MNLNDLPGYEPDISILKRNLEKFCNENSITRFEAEDIIELLEDGEDVAWIAQQLQQDNAEIDLAALSTLLSSIQSIVAPPKEEAEEEPEFESNTDAEPATDEPFPPVDMSQLDLAQLAPEMEAFTGMKMPDGVDLNHLKKVMEGPQGKLITDFGVWCQEQGIDMTSLKDPKAIHELNEQWMQTPRPAFDGKTPAEVSQGDPSMMSFKKVETYRREQPRIGRNDPCPCGSGKKYKKCCGRGK